MKTTKRILIIDDDTTTRESIAEVLQEEGYKVATAADGHDGITQFTTFAPHLVITDLQMPRLNGLGVIAHVQSISPATPIIIFTAEIAVDAQRKAQDLGIAGYVNKPIELTDMLNLIEQTL